MSWLHRCIFKVAAVPLSTPIIFIISMFGFLFLQYFVDGHQVVKADRSLLILELRPCRPCMPHYITPDFLGDFHTVSYI